MNEMIILFLIFGTLFVVEKKSINLLAYYIGMVIIIAIVISNFGEINNNYFTSPLPHMSGGPTPWSGDLTLSSYGVWGLGENIEYNVGISYISYILVLVQISALTILFGFIIMLFPKNNTDPTAVAETPGYKIKTIYQTPVPPNTFLPSPHPSVPLHTNPPIPKEWGAEGLWGKGWMGRVIYSHRIKIFFISFLIFFWFILLFLTKILPLLSHNLGPLVPSQRLGGVPSTPGYLYNLLFEIFSQYTPQGNIPPILGINSTANFLNKLSSLLYSELSNIFKFLIITIILLFAIIGLFFLLYPTFTTRGKSPQPQKGLVK